MIGSPDPTQKSNKPRNTLAKCFWVCPISVLDPQTQHRNQTNPETLCQRETIAFCMQKARELGSKGKKKNVDKEKRPEWNFLQKNWHLQPFQGLILTQVIVISH